MRHVCSDTGIWLDFCVIDSIDIPFRLPETFVMYEEAIRNEILNPPNLAERLLALGLEPVGIVMEELVLAQSMAERHRRLSRYDVVALAIAEHRGIPLVTGDARLRRVAERRGVLCMGTLGILDRLGSLRRIGRVEMLECLLGLRRHNGGAVRLPMHELDMRIAALAP